VLSPLLANIYLNDLDSFVEATLIPAYRRGVKRKGNREYQRLCEQLASARTRGDLAEIKRLTSARRRLTAGDPCDPNYRRLRYLRYADDFLLGFIGPKSEAEEIRSRLGEFLGQNLKLTLSPEKTLVTHATDTHAKFLGYEISITREGSLLSDRGRRNTNGRITFRMPRSVVQRYRDQFSKRGKISHRSILVAETDYTILQRYQGILRGLYNYYCMAVNVSRRMNAIKLILETSLTKTLASKFKVSVSAIYRKYQVVLPDLRDGQSKAIRIVVQRPDKDPLVAIFGGISFKRNPEGMVTDFCPELAWSRPANSRSEVVQRLMFGKCELCGSGPMAVHHIRKLRNIDRPGRRPKAEWEKIMAARKRKTLVVCVPCHNDIHAGRYDGRKLK
jgi:hypothetical protein